MSENTFQTITSKLWAMANELRGNMDANEFKNYILAFMFYRYLSEHQENYLVTNNVIDVPEGMSVNDAYKEEAKDEDLADYLEDISSSLGYAIAPLFGGLVIEGFGYRNLFLIAIIFNLSILVIVYLVRLRVGNNVKNY